MGIRTWPPVALAFAFGACAAALLSLWLGARLPAGSDSATAEPTANGLAPGAVSYADAVARAAPAVVNIFSSRMTTEQGPSGFRNPMLQRQFGELLPERARQRLATSLGSGVILSRDGLLLTNRHIVKDAEEIRVVLADGTDLDVRLVGADPETDLAVLKASARDLPVIPIGRADRLRVGDVVLAIGNPFGVGQTVTMGIVGATGRHHLGISSIENFIQTDAAINPGNSGGALINAHGELIGINTAIFSQSGGSEGVGFAIPIDLATEVASQVIASGRVARGWIGVVGRAVNTQVAQSFGLRVSEGVLISSTRADSPAARADIRPGDVVTRVNGRTVASTHELLEAVASAGPGANIELELWRGSERRGARITTIERPLAAQD
ncbi:MAG: trypsin-like peptidase domain-containing protein [Chromatiaceae bacterium]|nr:trypsin-like peptidase domain-containing protein [Chromatiaceae bacterium]